MRKIKRKFVAPLKAGGIATAVTMQLEKGSAGFQPQMFGM